MYAYTIMTKNFMHGVNFFDANGLARNSENIWFCKAGNPEPIVLSTVAFHETELCVINYYFRFNIQK